MLRAGDPEHPSRRPACARVARQVIDAAAAATGGPSANSAAAAAVRTTTGPLAATAAAAGATAAGRLAWRRGRSVTEAAPTAAVTVVSRAGRLAAAPALLRLTALLSAGRFVHQIHGLWQ